MWRIVGQTRRLPSLFCLQKIKKKESHGIVLTLFNNQKQLDYAYKLLTDCLVILVRATRGSSRVFCGQGYQSKGSFDISFHATCQHSKYQKSPSLSGRSSWSIVFLTPGFRTFSYQFCSSARLTLIFQNDGLDFDAVILMRRRTFAHFAYFLQRDSMHRQTKCTKCKWDSHREPRQFCLKTPFLNSFD